MMKRKPLRFKKITESARGEDCTLRIPGVCNGNPDTVVWAHSNMLVDGKGMGQKADDIFGCYACSDCHDVLDRRRTIPGWSEAEALNTFHRAMKKSWRRLFEKGVLVCK